MARGRLGISERGAEFFYWLRTESIRRPIHRMQFTAIALPIALYLGPSFAGFPLCGTSVHPSGNPWSRSHSSGVNRRTPED